jgi:hypothetical protein
MNKGRYLWYKELCDLHVTWGCYGSEEQEGMMGWEYM